MRKFAGDIIFLHMFTKNHNHIAYDVWFLIYGVIHTEFFLILGHFLLCYHPHPNDLENQNFVKNEKNAWRYYPFTHTFVSKGRSYDKWFLKYKVWQTDFLSFWAIFCPFSLLTTWKIKILKNWKYIIWIYYHFTHLHHKWQSYDVWLPGFSQNFNFTNAKFAHSACT